MQYLCIRFKNIARVLLYQWQIQTQKCMIMTFLGADIRIDATARIAEYPPSAHYGPRTLGRHQLLWLLTGSVTWRVEPAGAPHLRSEHVLRPGTLALVRPGLTDSFAWDRKVSSSHAFVHFDVGDAGSPPASMGPVVKTMAGNPPLAGLCDYLLALAALNHAEVAKARSDEIVRLLYSLMIDGPLGAERDFALPPAVLASMDHVRKSWAGATMRIMSLPELAGAAGISVGHYSRLFRQAVGTGPVAALELLRLARAAMLLLHSNMELNEIAAVTGFGDAFHFSHRFAKAYGVPPGRYRATGVSAEPHWPLTGPELLPLWRALNAPKERGAPERIVMRSGHHSVTAPPGSAN